MQLIASIDCQCTLGEGVVYDEQTDCLLWTDIIEKKFYVYDLAGEALSTFDLPHRLGSFGLTHSAGTIIAAFEQGFAYYQWQLSTLDWICSVEDNIPYTRLNDGRVDRTGRFWAGSMVESDKKNANAEWAQRTEKGALYCLDSQGLAQAMLGDIHISNSLCWSPDGNTLYHTDTPTRTIYSYAYDQKQLRLSNKKIFAETAPECFPDGSCVDAAGNIWNAQWGGWQVQCFAPNAEVLQTLKVPVSQPSCVCFAGKDLNLLAVTSARQGLSTAELALQPEAGNLLIYRTSAIGLKENRCTNDYPVMPYGETNGKQTGRSTLTFE